MLEKAPARGTFHASSWKIIQSFLKCINTIVEPRCVVDCYIVCGHDRPFVFFVFLSLDVSYAVCDDVWIAMTVKGTSSLIFPSYFSLSLPLPVRECACAMLIDKRVQGKQRLCHWSDRLCDAGLMPRRRSCAAVWLLKVIHAAASADRQEMTKHQV